MDTIDILMITHNRPIYTQLSLTRLLATCDVGMRVWIWQNGSDAETLAVVRQFLNHPNVYRFHHSLENKKLREPTNWVFANGIGGFVTKVDDDCLMPFGWADILRRAHNANPELGAISCWHYQEADFVPEIAAAKLRGFRGNHQLLLNCWVAGSGYLMKRACVEQCGLIRPSESFTSYCIRLAQNGWINGWYFPFLLQDHMDDPRSRHTMLKTEEDFAKWAPLSSGTFGCTNLDAWTESLKADARVIQSASADPSHYRGWRQFARRIQRASARLRKRLSRGFTNAVY